MLLLQSTPKRASYYLEKLLRSAVANAAENHDVGADISELYVKKICVDEGPTLKRWRPRARGRATRINKRTCHITMIVSRFSGEEMDERRSRDELRGRAGSDATAERARRVARSKAAEADESVEEDELAEDEADIEDLAEATADRSRATCK